MKKYVTRTRHIFSCLLLTGTILYNTPTAAAQNMSNDALYANGYKEYTAHDWPYAAVYLFAYIQRNPTAFADDPGFKTEVVAAYNHSIQALNKQVSDLRSCRDQVASLTKKAEDGVASITQGLETTPPPLRAPAKIRPAAVGVQRRN